MELTLETMMDMDTVIESSLEQAMSYAEYRALTDNLVEAGKSTAPKEDDPQMAEYVKLNRQRMKRMDKTIELSDEMKDMIANLKGYYTWLLIAEPWCGDASRHVPVLAKMAALTDHIDLKIVLRDQDLELMDLYLTNGGRSIPKLVVLDTETLDEIDTWGPRPANAQQLVLDHKHAPEPKLSAEDFKAELQRWYDADKGRSLQAEMLELFPKWESKWS